MEKSWRKGACHCGAVTFEVFIEAAPVAHECNCSICRRVGFLHLITPKSAFRLLTGEDVLTLYTFNSHTARHFFCRACGVKPFYVPRSNPDGWSVNLRCLEDDVFEAARIEPFDGRNWEANAASLTHLSKEADAP